VNLLVDTNCVLYLLGGDETLGEFLHGKAVHISFVSELELLSYPGLAAQDERVILDFLGECFVFDLNTEVKTYTVEFRRHYLLYLDDAGSANNPNWPTSKRSIPLHVHSLHSRGGSAPDLDRSKAVSSSPGIETVIPSTAKSAKDAKGTFLEWDSGLRPPSRSSRPWR
jgi:hypothetical protein